MRRLKLREIKKISAKKWRNWDMNLGDVNTRIHVYTRKLYCKWQFPLFMAGNMQLIVKLVFFQLLLKDYSNIQAHHNLI